MVYSCTIHIHVDSDGNNVGSIRISGNKICLGVFS